MDRKEVAAIRLSRNPALPRMRSRKISRHDPKIRYRWVRKYSDEMSLDRSAALCTGKVTSRKEGGWEGRKEETDLVAGGVSYSINASHLLHGTSEVSTSLTMLGLVAECMYIFSGEICCLMKRVLQHLVRQKRAGD